MKRHLWIFAIALLLGAAVNLIVAWIIAIYHPAMHEPIPSQAGFIRFTLGRTVFTYHVGDYRAAKIYECRQSGTVTQPVTGDDALSAGLPKWAVLDPEYDGVEGDPLAERYEATGWPMLAFSSATFSSTGNPQPRVVGGIAIDSLPRRTTVMMATTMPLRPLFPGAIVNTGVYSLAAWLLVAGPFVVRRALRTRRGRCPSCGYPGGTSVVCTECGRALPVA